eukprot:NODE_7688_length_580_cov_41.050773_g7665_i0.p1 GENE.NODE_7688_length_580_cov_41.050773_g7665_i0~~NODE_7688_length_580_cov_41.050773_g7665_i0.p1  ORF type:complete len:112 (-),score=29.40 NODE_7688_length_580_cov_41.050773_g7665_i0:122-457(-)
MTDNLLLNNRDPFADEVDETDAGKSAGNVHIRTQQRNGRKCVTTVAGLSGELDLKRILKEVKKQFSCNGSINKDPEHGEIIQLQGDQRENVKKFLLDEGLVDTAKLKVHGF